METYKIVCIDIDGTLLNSAHQITEATKETILQVINDKQIPVVLVSARMPKAIIPLQKHLGISEPLICYSGALVIDKHGNKLNTRYIDKKMTQRLLDSLAAYDLHVSLYKDDEWYIEQLDAWALQERDITNIEPRIYSFSKLTNGWREETDGTSKILCMGDPEEIRRVLQVLRPVYGEEVNLYLSKPTYLEIMSKKASKTAAIQILLKEYQLKQSDCLAIGDNYNDIDMLAFAGLGIAMENAPLEVKAAANTVTLSNDEDGVAHALKNHILFPK
ncbi:MULTISPECIES: Cof-type HAD-IIB family hydrolase [Paenibacillus]|uniref:Haloacid dehalogenase n=2 Tax=Paenibacillus TaxID=44249 RepID=A0ABX2ZIH8_PAEPO|nr:MULTISPECIES: Cof-type HAD-IIB family hydrolase [Paenibacillus]APQ59516.1 haloacid dehalogenase [Paenibacillus polymyxa]MDR6775869.1 Cof subfamily protein (haloacid dehalogenase superfamily) [Paenibacillus peoriae]ODA11179.1 haloacid dehalogenase [Paenibacillus polymyxa]ODB58481.1 haloacid dehalogenase [Paenibacillus polymyxa]OME66460.1 haloacid dehalogenase [Paenibacillus peoriae]